MCPNRLRWRLVCLALVLSAAGAEAQLLRSGAEFQVNTTTAAPQKGSDVAAAASGGFVVVWQSYQDGGQYGVFGQRFSSAGARLGSEFQANTYTTSHQFAATVAMDGDGDFVVVWQSKYQDGGGQYGVFGRRFSSSGTALGSEFQVNSQTLDNQKFASVAASAAGAFVVAWASAGNQDGSSYGIFAQRFSSAGERLGVEFTMNSGTNQDQLFPSVAANPAGDFVAVWQSRGQDGDAQGVFGRRFSSAGIALAVEFQVNSYTPNYQTYPQIAIDSDGDFVVAWQSIGQHPDYAIFARRFSSAGTAQGVELEVAAQGRYPAVADAGSHGFVVTWETPALAVISKSVLARHYSSTGAALAAAFQVNTFTADDQYRPAAATDPDGNFVVVWTSTNQDDSSQGVFGQRLAVLATLDVDGNGGVDALTDGLLVLRFLFGFSGGTLTAGAVGGGCSRCDSAAIVPYLAGLGTVLDVDGNTMLEALADGLLALRYLFGFTGTTLTNGATGAGCTRCQAVDIEPYLAALVQ